MNHDTICPHCDEDLTEYEEGEGYFSFYDPDYATDDRIEGDMDCPSCGGLVYVDAGVRTIERG